MQLPLHREQYSFELTIPHLTCIGLSLVDQMRELQRRAASRGRPTANQVWLQARNVSAYRALQRQWRARFQFPLKQVTELAR